MAGPVRKAAQRGAACVCTQASQNFSPAALALCNPVCTFLSQGAPVPPGALETAVSFHSDWTKRVRLYSLLPSLMAAHTTQPCLSASL